MIQLYVIVAYLALLLLVGGLASRLLKRTSEDYLLASHSIGPLLLLMSLFGTTMTAFALVGSTAEAYHEGVGVYGLLASSSGIVHSLCFFLIGVPLWSIGRRHGYATQIEFFRERLDSSAIGLVLFPILVTLVVLYLLIGVLGAGGVVEGVTRGALPELFPATGGGVPRWLGSLVVCGVVLGYVFAGGMRATAWANAFQTAVFMSLGVVTFYIIASRLGGSDSLLENLRTVGQAIPDDLRNREHIPMAKFASFLLIPLSVGMFPHVFQHWLTARSAAAFKLPVVAHPLFILIVWAPCVLIGVWAATELAALPAGTPDNQILAAMVRRFAGGEQAGAILSGCLIAGVLAAIMSSLDSQFLCLGTIFTNDIVLHYGHRERFSEAQRVWLARGFIVAIVAASYLLSLSITPRVFKLGEWCFSGFTGLVPLVVAAIYWRRLTLPGAVASIACGGAVWGYLFVLSDFAQDATFTVWWGMAPVVPVTATSAVALVLVSLATRPPSEATLRKFFP